MEDDAPLAPAASRLIRGFIKEHPWLTAVSLLVLLLVPVQDILMPHLTGAMVNAVRGGSAAGAVWKPFIAVVVTIALLQSAYTLSEVHDAWLYPTMHNYFRRELLGCVMEAHDTTQGLKARTGNLLSQLMNLPYTMAFWLDSVRTLVPHVFVFLFAIVYMGALDRALGVCVAAVCALVVGSIAYSLRTCSDMSMQRTAALNQVHE